MWWARATQRRIIAMPAKSRQTKVMRRKAKMKGTVKFFNSSKGFGFITGEDGTDYFVHSSGLKEGAFIGENDAVEFEPTQGDRGPKAVNVSKE